MECKNILKTIVLCIMFLCTSTLVACDAFPHTHIYDKVGSDSMCHWKYCQKDNEIEKGSRELHIDEDDDGVCDVCGYVMYTHSHDYSQIDYDVESHWYKCKNCAEIDRSTKEEHKDENKDGHCDVCRWPMPLPLEENIEIENWDGSKRLKISGPIPDGAQVVKLHYNDGHNDYYCENLSVGNGNSYIFALAFTTFSVGSTYVFEVYAYSGTVATGTPTEIVQLDGGKYFDEGYTCDLNNCRYTVMDIDGKFAIKVENI